MMTVEELSATLIALSDQKFWAHEGFFAQAVNLPLAENTT